MSMTSAILWQNEEKTVTLIDIPRSISAAQGTADEPCEELLLSSEPLQTQFPSTESKSAQAKLPSNLVDDALHKGYRDLLEETLGEVKSHHNGSWCLPRYLVATDSHELDRVSKKRKSDLHPSTELPFNLFTGVIGPCLNPPDFHFEAEDITHESDYEPGSYLWAHITRPATLILTNHDLKTGRSTDYSFRQPTCSTAFVGNCSDPDVFHELARGRKQKFDFIVLDPPWPNRSVKRSHKTPGISYSTVATLDDIRRLLLKMDMPALLSEHGYIGMWITNKPAIRELVLCSGGIFDQCKVELVEEWIWLKTTVHGEPVTPLEGTWNGRKPYEVLLLGRKRSSMTMMNKNVVEVKRRVLVGVPDLHSRKPCLKEMVEQLVGCNGKVLEVFARYLVSGWWSWGDECLKYNWRGFWQKMEEAADGGPPGALTTRGN